MWTTVCPATRAAKSAVPRPSTASMAVSSASMRNTVSSARSKTSAGSAATSAPAADSGSQRPGVRFQTTSGVPARARLSAMGCPMTPRPTKPTYRTMHHRSRPAKQPDRAHHR